MTVKTPVDAQGQPLNRLFNAKRLSERAVDELVGLCRGVVADAEVSDAEVAVLIRWVESNREAASWWPANVIFARVREMLVDNLLDAEERRELVTLLSDLVGHGEPVAETVASMSAALPLTKPPPIVVFPNRLFCLTGAFAFGSRKECEKTVLALGAETQSAPTRKTNYVVVGAMGSSDWIHSSYGRKIEKAVNLREQGFSVAIVSEDHWTRSLISPDPTSL